MCIGVQQGATSPHGDAGYRRTDASIPARPRAARPARRVRAVRVRPRARIGMVRVAANLGTWGGCIIRSVNLSPV